MQFDPVRNLRHVGMRDNSHRAPIAPHCLAPSRAIAPRAPRARVRAFSSAPSRSRARRARSARDANDAGEGG